MKFFSQSKPAPKAPPIEATAAALHAAAAEFIEQHLADCSEHDRRVLELSARNGELALHIRVMPDPQITIESKPGEPSHIHFHIQDQS
ncbi:MAG: hypothetical protein V9G29_11490 [Burkholderiaceae bacterium]